VIERDKAAIVVFLTLSEPTKPMIREAAGAGQFEMEGFSPVPRIQIVTIAQAMELRDRALRRTPEPGARIWPRGAAPWARGKDVPDISYLRPA